MDDVRPMVMLRFAPCARRKSITRTRSFSSNT